MRFDYYASTIEEKPLSVLSVLSKLGDRVERCDNLARKYHYTDGYAVHGQEGLACKVFLKDDQRPYAFASSDSADKFCAVVRENWADRHLVTRADPCEDFYDPSARKKIRKICRKISEMRGIQLAELVKPIDKTLGETTYLGSKNSDYRVRAYDKGWELFADYQARCGKRGVPLPKEVRITMPDGVSVLADDLFRVELQARPSGEEAKRKAALATPEEIWGFSGWTAEFAALVFALDLERIYIRARKKSSDDQALDWMLLQYKNVLNRLVNDCGSWECAGLTLGLRMKALEEETLLMQRSS